MSKSWLSNFDKSILKWVPHLLPKLASVKLICKYVTKSIKLKLKHLDTDIL